MLLVTGGAGFIGSNIVAALNAAGRADIAIADGAVRDIGHEGLRCATGSAPRLSLQKWPRHLRCRDFEQLFPAAQESNNLAPSSPFPTSSRRGPGELNGIKAIFPLPGTVAENGDTNSWNRC